MGHLRPRHPCPPTTQGDPRKAARAARARPERSGSDPRDCGIDGCGRCTHAGSNRCCYLGIWAVRLHGEVAHLNFRRLARRRTHGLVLIGDRLGWLATALAVAMRIPPKRVLLSLDERVDQELHNRVVRSRDTLDLRLRQVSGAGERRMRWYQGAISIGPRPLVARLAGFGNRAGGRKAAAIGATRRQLSRVTQPRPFADVVCAAEVPP
jgi:hypothetical protein